MNPFIWNRRRMLGTAVLAPVCAFAQGNSKEALPRRKLVFPQDSGAHTEFANEWWYITGYANGFDEEAVYGFQVTFFRRRVDAAQPLQSKFAAKHLLFAHAALTDVKGQKLWSDQRIARWSGAPATPDSVDSAWASTRKTHVELDNWSLTSSPAMPPLGDVPNLQARVEAAAFSMDLRFFPRQKRLLQGDAGLSRKGPSPALASYYYSVPQLRAEGTLQLNGKRLELGKGSTAWLDHEWSNALLEDTTVGWDWIGMNLFDGSALTAFQLRKANGMAVWTGGSWRTRERLDTFANGDVRFTPTRYWQSPHTQARYPVAWSVRTPQAVYTVRAVVDNQELDSRNTTATVYWEGLSEIYDSKAQLVGRGYLEMTGYAAPLKL